MSQESKSTRKTRGRGETTSPSKSRTIDVNRQESPSVEESPSLSKLGMTQSQFEVFMKQGKGKLVD